MTMPSSSLVVLRTNTHSACPGTSERDTRRPRFGGGFAPATGFQTAPDLGPREPPFARAVPCSLDS